MTLTAFKRAFRLCRIRAPYGSYVAALEAAGADFFPMCRTSPLTAAAKYRRACEPEIARYYLDRVRAWSPPMDLP